MVELAEKATASQEGQAEAKTEEAEAVAPSAVAEDCVVAEAGVVARADGGETNAASTMSTIVQHV